MMSVAANLRAVCYLHSNHRVSLMRLDDIAASAMNGRRIWPRHEGEHERRLHLMWLILVAREHRKRVLNVHIILIACV
jgi:hypothetical protein